LILSNEYSISRFIEEAKSLGFVAVGFSRPDRPMFFDQFCSWIAAGKHGEMAWMERNLDLRANPEGLLDGCRTVISLAFPYSFQKPCTPDESVLIRHPFLNGALHMPRASVLSEKTTC